MQPKAMTFEQALAFRLPIGKTIREATAEDWYELARLAERKHEENEMLDPATMTQEDCQKMQAWLDRDRDFNEALAVIKAELQKRGKPTW
jgi:hypothetical protein